MKLQIFVLGNFLLFVGGGSGGVAVVLFLVLNPCGLRINFV